MFNRQIERTDVTRVPTTARLPTLPTSLPVLSPLSPTSRQPLIFINRNRYVISFCIFFFFPFIKSKRKWSESGEYNTFNKITFIMVECLVAPWTQINNYICFNQSCRFNRRYRVKELLLESGLLLIWNELLLSYNLHKSKQKIYRVSDIQ